MKRFAIQHERIERKEDCEKFSKIKWIFHIPSSQLSESLFHELQQVVIHLTMVDFFRSQYGVAVDRMIEQDSGES